MAESILVTGKRISSMELVTNVTGNEKIPTGQPDDLALTPNQIADHTIARGDLASQEDLSQVEVSLGTQISEEEAARIAADNLKVDKEGSVSSVAGRVGDVVLAPSDVLVGGFGSQEDVNKYVPKSFLSGYTYGLGERVVLNDGEVVKSLIDGNVGNPNVDMTGWISAVSDSLSGTIQTFNTPEAGVDPVTGVVDGAYYNVRSSSDESYADEYQNVGGNAVATGKRNLSALGVQQGEKAASTIKDASGDSQQQINDRGGALWYDKLDGYSSQEKALILNGAGVRSTEDSNTTNPNTDMSKWAFTEHLVFKTLAEMLAYQNPKTGQVAHMLGVLAPTNFELPNPHEGGGFFIYDEAKTDLNDGGTIFNGWVRQYSGDVDISWFGAVQGADASPFIESALKVSKSVVIRGNYTLETICGIPNQNNYSKTVIRIRGENQATLTVNCPTGAVFTSASAKADPTNLTDKYTGKINVSGLNFIGTTISNSAIFNGDRLYNMYIHHNNFHGSVTIIKAYLKRLASRQYTQSTDISYNHLAHVYRVIETDRAYNFSFEFNACENCIGGMYIGADDPYDPSGMSLSIFRNLWESSGLILKSNGGIIAGSVSKNYFESNNIADAAVEKCQVYINRTGAGAGHSSGLVFDSNFFSGSAHVAGYVDVRLMNTPDTTLGNTKTALSLPAVFIGNWSENEQLTNNPTAILIGNRCRNRQNMLNAYTAQEARVSFVSGSVSKPVTTSPVRFMTIDTRPCLTNGARSANFKASMDVMLNFTTIGAVNTATAGFKLDLMVFAAYGPGTPPKAGLRVSMTGFDQSSGSDKITDTVNMASVFSSPTLDVIDNGDGTYHLELGTFTNYSAPNWGNIRNVTVTHNMQGSVYLQAGISSFNLLGIS